MVVKERGRWAVGGDTRRGSKDERDGGRGGVVEANGVVVVDRVVDEE